MLWCAVLLPRQGEAQTNGSAATVPTAPLDRSPWRMVQSLTAAHDLGEDAAAVRRWKQAVGNDRPMLQLLEATRYRLAYREDSAVVRYGAAALDSSNAVAPMALAGLAAIIAERGSYVHARDSLAKAIRLLRRRPGSDGRTALLLSQARIALRLTGADSARALLEEARTALRSSPDSAHLHASLACTQALVNARAGARITDSTWNRVIANARPYGPRLLAECQFARAQYLESTGLADRALAVLDTVAALQARARLWPSLVATRQWQGSILSRRGRYAEATGRLDDALEASKRVGRPIADVAWVTLEQANIAQRLGAGGDALRLLTVTRAAMARSGDAIGLGYVDRSQAELMHLAGLLGAADSLWATLVQRADAVAPQLAIASLVARSDIARHRNDLTATARLLDSASYLIEARTMPGWRAEWRYARGLYEMASGRPQEAITEFDSLLRAQRNLRAPARFEVIMRWAEAQSQRGQFDRAWSVFRTGARDFDRWRTSLVSREAALGAIGDRHFDWDRDLGLATVTARFANAGRGAEALAMAEWRRLRAAEQVMLQRGALAMESRTVSAVAVGVRDTGGVDPARLPALAKGRLAATQTVLSFVTGRGGEPTTAFVLTRDTLVSVALPAIDSLAPMIARVASLLRDGVEPAGLLTTLSEAVLWPVHRYVPASTRQLIVVPDGEFHRLPFVALRLPDAQVLIDRYDVVIAPSVEDALGGAVGVARRPGASSVVMGAPAQMGLNRLTGIAWGELPGAREEVRRVSQLLGPVTTLSGARVTRSALVQRLPRGGPVLHVATHAVADPGSFTNNGLVVQATSGNDGFFSLADLRTVPLPFDLVVLSACASGDGVLLAGQPLHGLVSSALDAGARGVVATRWALSDTAIVPYMSLFYERLRESGNVSAAINEVQRRARRDGSSPALWANLTYTGDPLLRVVLEAPPSWWSRVRATVRGWLPGRVAE